MKFGLILSLTAVLVVFAALTVLYFCYLWMYKTQISKRLSNTD